nr:alpha/beta hydrolase fold domain-containing protein [Tessaracoccus coleopterorum]
MRYSINEHATGPNPAVDAARAVRWVRAHAEELGNDPTRVAVLGFSAGGHVTGMIGTAWDDPALETAERAEYDALVAAGVEINAGLMAFSPAPTPSSPATRCSPWTGTTAAPAPT